MNRFISLLAVLVALPLAAPAQDAGKVADERARIARERGEAETRFAREEKACYGKFAVNDCINEARTVRREKLADLRRQEVSLNDAERKRKGADHMRRIEEKTGAQAQEREAKDRAAALETSRKREERAAEKASNRAEDDAGRKVRAPAVPKAAPKPDAEAARKHAERLQEAKARRERIEKKQRERTKEPAKPLPTPP